jgi:1-deoxy-D-xylulose-5-phosphate reductoisomerase
MGRKVTIDSASLMNKGLEVIEAHWLFDLPSERIDAIVHPQSVVHSMVDYADGSVLAQMGVPDMRTAIGFGLSYPERIDTGVESLDLIALTRLDFEAPDRATFPCLDLAYTAIAEGGNAAAVLNAANEVAVEAFLQGRIPFLGIPDIIERTLALVPREHGADLAVLLASDAEARRRSSELFH